MKLPPAAGQFNTKKLGCRANSGLQEITATGQEIVTHRNTPIVVLYNYCKQILVVLISCARGPYILIGLCAELKVFVLSLNSYCERFHSLHFDLGCRCSFKLQPMR